MKDKKTQSTTTSRKSKGGFHCLSEVKISKQVKKAYGFTVYARIKEVEQVMDLLVCECEPEPQTYLGGDY